jgi:cytochrome c556
MEMTMMFRSRWIVLAAMSILLNVVGSQVYSHGGATGVVKERMERMERLDELMDRVFAMVRGEVPYDAATVRKAAIEIQSQSGTTMTQLFPEGSAGKPSEARPAIWKDFDTFSHFADRLAWTAGILAEQSDSPGDGFALPRKWEDVIMGPGMMGRDNARPGRGPQNRGPGTGGPGRMGGGMMMGGGTGAAFAAVRVAAHCNACHQQFRMVK